MAFNRDNFSKISSGYAHIVSPQMFSYLSPVDDITAMLVSGYFDEVNQETDIVSVGDLFLLDPPATHATLVTVASLNPVVLGPAIEGSGLVDGSVTTPKLANLAVTTPKIADLAVDLTKLANDSVITPKIVNAAVTNDKIQGGTITGDRLVNQTITDLQLAPDSVITSKINDAAVTNVQLADNAVRTAKILDDNVTLDKLAPNIKPFSVSVHQSHVNTVGGAVVEIFAVSGILASDFVFATMESPGASTPVIVDSFGQANAIHVRFSVDPSADTLLLLSAFRAT